MIGHSTNNYVIFRNVIQDLIKIKHVKFPEKNETIEIDENIFLSINTLIISNDILLSQGVTFATIIVNELFDALIAGQILRFAT